MKNIHVIPTDKPSRLYLGNNGNFVFGMIQTSIQSRNDDFTNQNIYITNSEEIKDWYLNTSTNTIHKSNGTEIFDYRKEYQVNFKIILTTDQDLIAGGVQKIDDEFLDWFVQNSSCEEVKVNYGFFTPLGRQVDPLGLLQNHSSCVWKYKIIIPRECRHQYSRGMDEPRPRLCLLCDNPEKEEPTIVRLPTYYEPKREYQSECICDTECRGFINVKCKKPKQETLEEAYLNQLINEANKEWTLDRKLAKEVAIKFSKWQQEQDNKELGMWKLAVEKQEARCKALNSVISDLQERMYSELVDLLERLTTIYKEDSDLHQKYDKQRLDIIEQFKKK